MVRVRRRLVVLERGVVRAVVDHRSAADVLVRGPAHRVGARAGVGRGGLEAALEPAPRHVLLVQPVADVRAGHLQQIVRRGVVLVRAVVVGRVGVVDDGADAVRVGGDDYAGRGGRGAGDGVDGLPAVRLPR